MKVEAVILAAGTSSRMPEWKMALPLGPKRVIEWTVSAFLEVAQRVLVVGGYRFEELRQLLASYPVELVYNRAYREGGMFSSVKTGLQHVGSKTHWVFLHPADHPLVQVKTLHLLLQSRGVLVVPTYRGRKGHPLLIRGALVPEILAWPDTETLRTFVRSRPMTLVETADPGVVLDLDEPQDLATLEALLKRTSPGKGRAV